MSSRIPIIIVSGYLGAGKTTFLREIIPRLANSPRAPYVILNDFMNAEVDSAFLREVAPDVDPISGGCICCDSSVGLIKALEKIPLELSPIVFIEANGTTDPFPLIELLTLDTALIERFGPAYQITVINEARWQKRLFGWDKKIERAQAATASHLLTNRGQNASLKQQLRVKSDLQNLNPHAIRTTVDEFIAALPHLSEGPDVALSTAEPLGHAHNHLALRLDLPPMREDVLVRWLRSFPPEVLRIKGVVQLLDDPVDDACFFQRTDDKIERPNLIKTFMPEGADPCAVFIGNGMDEAKIRSSLDRMVYQNTPRGIPPIRQSLGSGEIFDAPFSGERRKDGQ